MTEPTLVAGDCVYLDADLPGFCDPPCGPAEMCTSEDECVSFPEYRPAGVMTLEGLAVPFTLTPNQLGSYDLEPAVPPDLFAPGGTAVLDVNQQQAGGLLPAQGLLGICRHLNRLAADA